MQQSIRLNSSSSIEECQMQYDRNVLARESLQAPPPSCSPPSEACQQFPSLQYGVHVLLLAEVTHSHFRRTTHVSSHILSSSKHISCSLWHTVFLVLCVSMRLSGLSELPRITNTEWGRQKPTVLKKHDNSFLSIVH
ncbi:hypothetical protein HZ326_10921 [Fusarium oxysporum f. sp. albedinis]|nr:hypothetical protein HZ326_10921 [Fusarium oxysporum f. sp. albedinis]